MRHHVFNLTACYTNTKSTYLFSVDANNNDELVRLLITRWTLSNETNFLDKAGSAFESNPANILKNLMTYRINSSVNCLIIADTDSCYKIFDDVIVEQGGIHLFKPLAWIVPDKSELILLKNKYSSVVDLYYHSLTETVWLQFNKSIEFGLIKLNDPDMFREYDVINQVVAMGL